MNAPAKPPSGPNLWAGLSSSDVRELIAVDVAELKRVYALKDIDDLNPPWRRNILLAAEALAWESAQDQHFAWLVDIEAREARDKSKSTLG